MTDQNQKPDYSFIMNQPGFDQTPKKSSKKPLIFIGFGVVTLLVIVGIVAVVGKKSTNIQEASNAQRLALNTATTYMSNLAGKRYGEAYDLVELADKNDAVSKDEFTKTVAPLLAEIYDFSTCKSIGNVQISGGYQTTLECNYANSSLTESFVFESATVGDDYKIVAITNPDREQQA